MSADRMRTTSDRSLAIRILLGLAVLLLCSDVGAYSRSIDVPFHLEPTDADIRLTVGETSQVNFEIRSSGSSNSTPHTIEGLLSFRVIPSILVENLSDNSTLINYNYDYDYDSSSKALANVTVTLKGKAIGHGRLLFYWKAAQDDRENRSSSSSSVATAAPATIESSENATTSSSWHDSQTTTEPPASNAEHVRCSATNVFWQNVTAASNDSLDAIKPSLRAANKTAFVSTTNDPLDDVERQPDVDDRSLSSKNATEMTDDKTGIRSAIIKERDRLVVNESKPSEASETTISNGRSRRMAVDVAYLRENVLLLPVMYRVHIARRRGIADQLATAIVGTSVVLVALMLGCRVKLSELWTCRKLSTGPIVIFVCQFGCMPLVAYGFGQLLLLSNEDRYSRWPLFITCCLSGGFGLNLFTVSTLGGDRNLGVASTFICALASTIATPIWMVTLGEKILVAEGNMNLSFVKLVCSLVALLASMTIGITIQNFKPGWMKVTKIVGPLVVVLVVAFSIIAGLTYTHLLRLFTWKIVAATLCVNLAGFVLGGATGLATRRLSRHELVSVAINVAIQNSQMAFLIIRMCLSEPDADLSTVIPLLQLTVVWLPLVVGAWLVELCRKIGDHRAGGSVEIARQLCRRQLENDVDDDDAAAAAVRPLVINRSSAVPPAVPSKAKRKAVDEQKAKTANEEQSGRVYANMYTEYGDSYYDKAYTKPRVELKLSQDAGLVRYDVPKSKMHTFEDDATDKKKWTPGDTLDGQI